MIWDKDADAQHRCAQQRFRLAMMPRLVELANVTIEGGLRLRDGSGRMIAEVRVDKDGVPIAVMVALP